MKYLYTLCTFLVLSMQQTIAQTHTLNWATSFVTNWLTGVLTGNANNINSSAVNATVSITSSQGNSAFTGFGSFSSPVVSGSPFAAAIDRRIKQHSYTRYSSVVDRFLYNMC
jgi:hypothetical protein